MISRRTFNRTLLSLGAAGWAGSMSRFGLLNALTPPGGGDYRALVCVFLYGGNDSNNMLVPLDTASLTAYQKLRANLALPAPTKTPAANTTPMLDLGDGHGLHPKMTGLAKLYVSKNLGFLANVGTLVQPTTRTQFLANSAVPTNLFSHADQQMEWQTSIPVGVATTGWAGRLADHLSSLNRSTFPTYVSVTGNSIFGTGLTTHPGSVTPGGRLGLAGFDTSNASNARMTALQTLLSNAISNQTVVKTDSGAALLTEAATTLKEGVNDDATLASALKSATAFTTAFPTTSIGQQLLEVAKLIQVRSALQMNRQIFFCSLGGFDTHTDELNSQNNLYSQLDAAMSAFYLALQNDLKIPQDVTLFTESDFSRTFVPNSTGGTDHAWGSHHIVLGGMVQGGNVYGKFPTMAINTADDAGGEGRWIPTTAVDQYGATLAQWFGASKSDLSLIFPNLGNFTNGKPVPSNYPVYKDPTNVGFFG